MRCKLRAVLLSVYFKERQDKKEAVSSNYTRLKKLVREA